MTANEFHKLFSDLRKLARLIPLNWGAIQNNQYDHLIDMFSCANFDSLENLLRPFGDQIKVFSSPLVYVAMWNCVSSSASDPSE